MSDRGPGITTKTFCENADMSETAGERLRRDLGKALEHAGRELGRVLEFSETETQIIDRAVATADRAEALGRIWAQDHAGHMTLLTGAANGSMPVLGAQ